MTTRPAAPAASALKARIGVSARGVDVAFALAPGGTLALLGPNGSGKSTVLGALAGVVRPDRGRVALGERILFCDGDRDGEGHGDADAEDDAGARTAGRGQRPIDVPPHRRRVALMAQQPLLFPHLSARENVAFAPRVRGASRAEARRLAGIHLADVGAAALADARPHELSGGQAQRVALARALAAEPDLLLLDEPLSALDAGARDELRRVLAGLSGSTTRIVVTHDPLDALLLADRAVVLQSGRVVEDAPVAGLLAEPRSPFAALLTGVTLVSGSLRGGAVRTEDGRTVPGTLVGPLTGARAEGAPVFAAVPPESVTIEPDPQGDARIEHLEVVGGALRVTAGGLVGRSPVDAGLGIRLSAPGAPVRVRIDPTGVRIYPRNRGV